MSAKYGGDGSAENREGPIKYLRLDLEDSSKDVVRFEEACRKARQTNALPDWEQAIQLYRGTLLPGYEVACCSLCQFHRKRSERARAGYKRALCDVRGSLSHA